MGKRGRIYNNFFTEEKYEKVNKINKEIMMDYVMELKQNQKKKTTIDQYKNDWRIIFIVILENFDNKSILEMTKKDFRRLSLFFKENKDMSNSRVNRLMSSTRSMLSFCEDDDDWDYDFSTASKVKGLPKEAVRDIIFMSDEQIKKLRDKLIERKEYQKATVLCLAYDSAGRKNELFQVKKNSFYDESKSLTNIVVGKRGKKFPLVYFDWTKECAKLYLEQRGQDHIDSMWIVGKGNNKRSIDSGGIYKWFISMADLISEMEGIEIPINVHSLRHIGLDNMSTGTHYICTKLGKEDGFSIEDLQKHAHHSDMSTTNSYLKNRDEEEILDMFGLNK